MTVLYGLGDVVQTRKPHPCGADTWTITRVGADIKIKCTGCGRVVMLERFLFDKRVKKVVAHVEHAQEIE